jgi:hypothetical protein
VFKNAGKVTMAESEVALMLSHGLRWLKPKDAERFMQKSLEIGLLERKGGGGELSPTFDASSVEVPLDFKLDEKAIDVDIGPTLFDQIISRTSVVSGLDRSQVISKINAKKERLDIDIRVAAILLAGEYGVSVDRFLDEAEAKVIEEHAAARTGKDDRS